jgi:hypothetical protein
MLCRVVYSTGRVNTNTKLAVAQASIQLSPIADTNLTSVQPAATWLEL